MYDCIYQQFHKTEASTGFSLVETLVSISILLTVVSGIMLLVNQSIDSNEQLSNRLTASYLASDAIEYLRWDRDSHWLDSSGNTINSWATSTLSNCQKTYGDQCQIDTRIGNGSISECESCPALKYSSSTKRYGHGESGSDWSESKFTRTLSTVPRDLDSSSTGDEEVVVIVTVEWPNRANETSSLTVSDTLTGWAD